MSVEEVKDSDTVKDFLGVVDLIYKGDENYVRPLDVDIEAIFDPNKNTFFSHGEASRFVLYDDSKKVIGRLGVFINEKKAFSYDQPTGGMGFFECINDYKAAEMLFETARKWLQARKMEAMDGPINFGENDRFWGLLIEGYTQPAYGMAYNPPYYKDLFEKYGFKLYYEMISNHLSMANPLPERFTKIANWVMQKPGYRFEHFKISETERYAEDFTKIYNEAWQFHENFTPISKKEVLENLNKMKPLLEERLIWFVYVNDEPSGFMINIPDANQIIKHLHGKMNFISKLKFMYHKMIGSVDRIRLVMMGVIPKHQKAGLESGMIVSCQKAILDLGKYDEVELSWVGDFNPKMRALQESVGASFGKKHYTYRKVFNGGEGAGRSTIIARDTKDKLVDK